MLDSYGRKIEYLRLSITDLCNLRCKYCMGEDGVCKKDHRHILTIEELTLIAQVFHQKGVKKLRVTGGEPLVRKGFDTLVRNLGEIGFDTLAVTTNGVLLPRYADTLRESGFSRVNVSLDSLDKDVYCDVTRGGNLEDALRGIDSALKAGFDKVKVNAVLMKGVNDDSIYDFALFGAEKGVEVRFIELMPFEASYSYAKDKFISCDTLVSKHNLTLVGTDGNCRTYAFPDGLKIGFIAPKSHKFCSQCNRVRVTADGKMLNCLHENKEYDLTNYLGDEDALSRRIDEVVKEKPLCHAMYETDAQTRPMGNIGG